MQEINENTKVRNLVNGIRVIHDEKIFMYLYRFDTADIQCSRAQVPKGYFYMATPPLISVSLNTIRVIL